MIACKRERPRGCDFIMLEVDGDTTWDNLSRGVSFPWSLRFRSFLAPRTRSRIPAFKSDLQCLVDFVERFRRVSPDDAADIHCVKLQYKATGLSELSVSSQGPNIFLHSKGIQELFDLRDDQGGLGLVEDATGGAAPEANDVAEPDQYYELYEFEKHVGKGVSKSLQELNVCDFEEQVLLASAGGDEGEAGMSLVDVLAASSKRTKAKPKAGPSAMPASPSSLAVASATSTSASSSSAAPAAAPLVVPASQSGLAAASATSSASSSSAAPAAAPLVVPAALPPPPPVPTDPCDPELDRYKRRATNRRYYEVTQRPDDDADSPMIAQLQPMIVDGPYRCFVLCKNKAHGGRCSRSRGWKMASGEHVTVVDRILMKWALDGLDIATRTEHMNALRH